MKKYAAALLLLASTLLSAGCVKQALVPGPISRVSVVPLDEEGPVSDIRGSAFVIRPEADKYEAVAVGEVIRFEEIFYLEPQSMVEITPADGEKIYIFSQEKRTWFTLEKKP